ncbi:MULTISPECIES: GNAT family N-acetyltransferase [Acidithiobacillus]|jgi:phosphinothricin acetyltransferase|uniref:GNAT family N-acetyltransferase n=1 Tax=Acidithiobacillus TaxID=119977 RepID=UPI001C074BA3|nr:GNAT family N-acetyltransferase [Acidithiobacillus thiooxidans]MBU2843854.1 N-acetyltransferase [Acidithiobacillus thiooxidans]
MILLPSQSFPYIVSSVEVSGWQIVSADIQRIFNVEIVESPFIYREKIFDDIEIEQWFLSRVQSGGLILSCSRKDNQKLVGFASYGPFRSFPGSVGTVEHSIYVDRSQRGQSIGSVLLHEITMAAQKSGRKALVGVIDSENLGSLHMHDQADFARVGCMKSLGYKWGAYRDAWFVQKVLA